MKAQNRTMVLMSDQPLFEALVIELGRGQLGEIDLGHPTDELIEALNLKMTGRPQYVDEWTISFLEKIYGPRLDDNLVLGAADRMPALPPTGAIPVIEATAILPKDESKKSPADIILNETGARKPRRAPRTPGQSQA